MKTVGATSVPLSTEAILSNARLESGDVAAPMATPVESQPEPAIQDSYEQIVARNDKPSNAVLDEARVQANPFDGLEQGVAEELRLSEQPQGIEQLIDPSAAQLARLNAALLAMSRAGKEIPAHVLEGYLMTGHDAQAAEKPMAAAQQKAFEQYATKLAANEATEADHKVFWAQMQIGEQDVMSFVQRVLREAYMIQNGTMYDMASQLKQTNDLRKKIQTELARARKTSGAWASESKGDDTWVSSEPYATLRVNEGAGKLEPDVMDEEELQEHEAQVQAQAQGGSQTGGPMPDADLASELAALDAPGSTLTEAQKLQMQDATSKDAIRANLPTILAAIPNMSSVELEFYVEAYLRTLKNAGDNSTILQLFSVMNPAQQLQVISDGFPQGYFNFDQKDAEKLRDATVLPVMKALGPGLDIQSYLRLNHHGSTYELTQYTAGQLLQQMRERAATADSINSTSTADVAKVGDQRTINTNKEMADYIQTLEDNVNSLGDDAQLQQIDLQDALQRNQQTMQMMSNLLKVLHDTAMAAIRNDNS